MSKLAMIAIALGLSAAACKGGGGSDLEGLKSQACSCKDMKCVEEVAGKMDAVEKKFEDKEPSAEEAKLGEEIEECLKTAMLGGK